jgi:hypothetical protein
VFEPMRADLARVMQTCKRIERVMAGTQAMNARALSRAAGPSGPRKQLPKEQDSSAANSGELQSVEVSTEADALVIAQV